MQDASTSRPGSNPPGPWVPPSLEEMQALLPQYEFFSLVGRGGMGAVYKARQISLDRLVAVKVLPGDLLDDADVNFVERFKQEARTMARMNHPAIVGVFDFGQTPDGMLYFVMEFVDGTDVAQMIVAQRRLPSAHALAITAHVCDALAYAHSHGVVHRDIKPANILINMEGAVKVADFGLAKANDALEQGLTKTNITMGTPDFVAPEALMQGVMVDGRADLYAVGVMLYQMLTGEIPRGMWQMPSVKVGTDARFDAIIAKAMQMDREMRYQTSHEIRKDLDRILTMPIVKAGGQESAAIPRQAVAGQAQKPVTRAPKTSQPKKTGQAAPPPKKKNSGVMMALGFGALAFGALGLVLYGTHEPAEEAASSVVAAPAEPTPPPKPSVTKTAAKPPEPPPAANAPNSWSEKAPVLGDKAVDILPSINLAQDVLEPVWVLENGALLMREKGSPRGCPRVELPQAATSDYILETSFTSAKEEGDLVLHLPLGKVVDGCSGLTLRAQIRQKGYLGVEQVKGTGAMIASNPTHVSGFDLRKGKLHQIMTRVETKPGKRIALGVWLSGEPLMGWEGKASDIRGFSQFWSSQENQAASRIAVGTNSPGLKIHRIRLQALDGEMRSFRLKKPAPLVAKAPPPKPAASPTPAPAPVPEPSPVPVAPDPIAIRLKAIEKQFHDAYEAQAGSVFKAAVADLNSKYVAALDRAIAAASQASKLDEALALREEKSLIQSQGTVPGGDAEDLPESVKTFRQTYRKAVAGLASNRDKLAEPLYAAYDRALANYQDELTRGQKLDEAQRVKAVREHVASQKDGGPAATAAPAVGPSAGTGEPSANVADGSATAVPSAPPLSVDKVLPLPPRASPAEMRDFAQWVIETKKGHVRVLEGGRVIQVNNMGDLPSGKLTMVAFRVEELNPEDDAKWISLMGRIPDLEDIFFNLIRGHFPMEELRGLTKLKSVRLAPVSVDDDSFAHLTGLKSLTSLHLTHWCKQFTGTGLGYINENLTEFTTDSDTLTSQGVAYLGRFKKLKKLTMYSCAILADSMLQPLVRMTDLEELNLNQNALDGSFLIYLSPNNKIRQLSIGQNENFKPQNAAHLARLKSLENLQLPPLNFGAAELSAIATLPNLKTLNLTLNNRFTGEGFRGAGSFPKLEVLNLGHCPLTDAGVDVMVSAAPNVRDIQLSRPKSNSAPFTPAALAASLGRLRNLTTLAVRDGGVTDDWLPHLAQLKNLNVLTLEGASITDAGLVHLKDLPITELRLDRTDFENLSQTHEGEHLRHPVHRGGN